MVKLNVYRESQGFRNRELKCGCDGSEPCLNSECHPAEFDYIRQDWVEKKEKRKMTYEEEITTHLDAAKKAEENIKRRAVELCSIYLGARRCNDDPTLFTTDICYKERAVDCRHQSRKYIIRVHFCELDMSDSDYEIKCLKDYIRELRNTNELCAAAINDSVEEI